MFYKHGVPARKSACAEDFLSLGRNLTDLGLQPMHAVKISVLDSLIPPSVKVDKLVAYVSDERAFLWGQHFGLLRRIFSKHAQKELVPSVTIFDHTNY
jgi:hypothetical protein